MPKNIIRQQCHEMRGQLTPAQREQASKTIVEHIIALPEYQSANCIAAYCAINSEVDLSALITHAWEQNKTVLLPKVVNKNLRLMQFFAVSDWQDLQRGTFGVREPNVSSAPVSLQTCSVIFLPCLGFSMQGDRLGMGAGFYDQALSEIGDHPIKKIAVAYAIQHVASLPYDPWDQRLDMVITENGDSRFSN